MKIKTIVLILWVAIFPCLFAILGGLLSGILMSSPVAAYLPQWFWDFYSKLGDGNPNYGNAVFLTLVGIPLGLLWGILYLLEYHALFQFLPIK